MTEKLEANLEVHSSNVSPKEAPEVPQAETVIAAAVETGKAQEAAETAAKEAQESAQKAETFLDQIRSAIKPELEAIHERLTAIEEAEAEEQEAETLTIPAEEEDTLTVASAETVTIEEPQKPPVSQSTKQEEPQQGKGGAGGFLKKIFLNR